MAAEKRKMSTPGHQGPSRPKDAEFSTLLNTLANMHPPEHEQPDAYSLLLESELDFLAGLLTQDFSPYQPSTAATVQPSGRADEDTMIVEDPAPNDKGSPPYDAVDGADERPPRVRISSISADLSSWCEEFREGELSVLFSDDSPLSKHEVELVQILLLRVGKSLLDLFKSLPDSQKTTTTLLPLEAAVRKNINRVRKARSSHRYLDQPSPASDNSVSDMSDDESSSSLLESLENDVQTLASFRASKRKRTAATSALRDHPDTASILNEARQLSRSPSAEKPRRRLSSGRRNTSGRPLSRDSRSPMITEALTSRMFSPGPGRSWDAVEERLKSVKISWARSRAAPEVEKRIDEKPAHLTLVISSNKETFRPDRLRELLAPEAQTEKHLAFLLSQLHIRDEAKDVTDEIISELRDTCTGLSRGMLAGESTLPLKKDMDSIDFTLSLLVSLPRWSVFTNSEGASMATLLCQSLETQLIDELLESACGLFSAANKERKTFGLSSTDLAAKCVVAFLYGRLEGLLNITLGTLNSPAWRRLQPSISDLLTLLVLLFGKLEGPAITPDSHDSTFSYFDTAVSRRTSWTPGERPKPANPVPIFNFQHRGNAIEEFLAERIPIPFEITPSYMLLLVSDPGDQDGAPAVDDIDVENIKCTPIGEFLSPGPPPPAKKKAPDAKKHVEFAIEADSIRPVASDEVPGSTSRTGSPSQAMISAPIDEGEAPPDSMLLNRSNREEDGGWNDTLHLGMGVANTNRKNKRERTHV